MKILVNKVDDLDQTNENLLSNRQYKLLYDTRTLRLNKAMLELRKAIDAHLLMKNYEEDLTNGE